MWVLCGALTVALQSVRVIRDEARLFTDLVTCCTASDEDSKLLGATLCVVATDRWLFVCFVCLFCRDVFVSG